LQAASDRRERRAAKWTMRMRVLYLPVSAVALIDVILIE
jgi:hypothetical protein